MSTHNDFRELSEVPVLTPETFPKWKWDIMAIFEGWGADGIVLGTEPVPTADNTVEARSLIANYKSRISRAAAAIKRTATISHRDILDANQGDPEGMWKALLAKYEVKDPGARFTALLSLWKAGGSKEPDETWSDYCNRIKQLSYNLGLLRPEGWNLVKETEERDAWLVLSAVPEHHPLRVALIQQDDITIAKVQAAFIRHQMSNTSDTKPIESAHVAASPAPTDKCRFCGKPGHWLANCKIMRNLSERVKAGERFDQGFRGGNRGNGHGHGPHGHGPHGQKPNGPALAYSAETGRGFAPYPQNGQQWTSPAPLHTAIPQYNQGPPFQLPYPPQNTPYPPQSTPYYAPSTTSHGYSHDVANMAAEFAGNASQSLSPSSPTADADWIADSGASSHMTSHLKWLRDFRPLRRPVKLADGSIIYAEGEGWILFEAWIDGKAVPFRLDGVLYVPCLKTNLLSTQKLTRAGKYTVHFIEQRVEIREGDTIVLTGSINDHNTFYINGRTESALAALAATSPAVPLSIWHRRFAHKDPASLRKLMESNAVTGFRIKRDGFTQELCEPCIGGKQTRAPHTQTASRADRVLGRIHSDLHGPLPVEGRGGFRYWVTFTDDKSRYVSVYFLRKKSETLQAFKEYKSLVENQLDLKIQCLRDDKGGEYMSKEFDSFCSEHGIRREHTIRDTPQQNGVAERFNRTLAEAIIALLIEANLPPSMWIDAASSFVHVHNRSPTTSLSGSTPFEIWYRKKPSVSHLRAWGCLAFVHVQKDQRNSLESHTRKCIFIRYALDYKGWVFWDPEKRTEIISDSAVFFETVFPGKMRLKSLPPIQRAHIDMFLPPTSPIMPINPHPEPAPSTAPNLPLNLTRNTSPNAPLAPHPPFPYIPAIRRPLSRELAALTDPETSQTIPRNPPPRRAAFGRNPGMYTIPESDDEEEANFIEATVPEFEATKLPDYVEITVEDGLEFAMSTSARIEPDTLQQALDSPDRDKWIAAGLDEIRSHLNNKT